MKTQQPVFLDQQTRELFSSEVVAGKKLRIAKYKNFFKNSTIVKVLESEVFNQTVDAFCQGNLNLAVASTNSFVHRNTLIYRIEKINKMIGLDLRNFEDCLLFVNMREIYKMVVKKQWCLKIQPNYSLQTSQFFGSWFFIILLFAELLLVWLRLFLGFFQPIFLKAETYMTLHRF